MSWKIFYARGEEFSSTDGEASAAPTTGVAVIAEKRGRERFIWKYGNLYAWFSQQWHTASVLRKSWVPDAVILRGEMISNTDFKETLQRAVAWL